MLLGGPEIPIPDPQKKRLRQVLGFSNVSVINAEKSSQRGLLILDQKKSQSGGQQDQDGKGNEQGR